MVQTNDLTTLGASDTGNSLYEYYPNGRLKKIMYANLMIIYCSQ